MLFTRSHSLLALSFLVLSLGAAGGAAEQPVEAPKSAAAANGSRDAGSDERGRARAEFVEARRRFAETLAAALSSEKLTSEIRDISNRLQLRKAEDRLNEVRARLDELQRQDLSATEQADRLRQRETALTADVETLRRPQPPQNGADVAKIATQVAAGRLRTSMAEETDYLSDVLSTDELLERTRRLRRLILVARVAGSIRAIREEEREDTSDVVPASGSTDQKRGDSGELGAGATAPPESESSPE